MIKLLSVKCEDEKLHVSIYTYMFIYIYMSIGILLRMYMYSSYVHVFLYIKKSWHANFFLPSPLKKILYKIK